jgi:hypothetical protein
MYFRIATRQQANTTYKYLQLVEAYREDGNNRQRVLHSFGNVDQLRKDGQLYRLAKSLERATGEPVSCALDLIHTEHVLEYGGVRLAQALWDQFGLTDLLTRQFRGRRFQFDPIAAIATMVFNRLLAPKSELGIFQWRDRLWWPDFASEPLELHHLYRALDALLEIKEPLEEALFGKLKHLFNLEIDAVFYDLTSSYFEGQGPSMAQYGYSRDKRPDQRQVLLALACERHGFPIAHEVLAGNRGDVSTLKEMVATLEKRLKLRRIIFVSDSGMVSDDNLQALTKTGYEYVVGLRRTRVPEVHNRAPADLSLYQDGPHDVKLHVTAAEDPGSQYVCCWSEGRAEQERQIREARIRKGQDALEKLAARVAAGRLKSEQKILAHVTTRLRSAKASKYFRCDVGEGKLDLAINQEQVAQEQAIEGRYFLLTNAQALTPQDAVEAYFTLQEVERAFREMKDFLQLRPMYHWKDHRVRAHIFVCVLAYLLERSLSHQLREAGLEMSPREALEWATRIHAVETKIDQHTIWTVSTPPPAAHKVLQAIGVSKLPTMLQDFQPLTAQ